MKKEDKNKAKLAAGAVGAGYVLGSENIHPIGYFNRVMQKSRQPFRKLEDEDFKVVKKLRDIARDQKLIYSMRKERMDFFTVRKFHRRHEIMQKNL